MTTLSERLAELSGKATEGDWQTSPLSQETQIYSRHHAYLGTMRDFHGDDAALIVELVNAYRAGRLIVKED